MTDRMRSFLPAQETYEKTVALLKAADMANPVDGPMAEIGALNSASINYLIAAFGVEEAQKVHRKHSKACFAHAKKRLAEIKKATN